jgi:hypothetical protein
MLRLHLIFLLFFNSFLLAQKINQLNRSGERTGRWITYADTSKKIKTMDARFKNGLAVGKSLYYYSDGTLLRREVKRFKKIKIKIYHPNGKLSQKGNARIDILPEKVHFYFYGQWKNHDTTGKLISYSLYEKGELITTTAANSSKSKKDSTCKMLLVMEQAFTAKNKTLLDTFGLCWNSPSLAEKYRNKIYQNDSLTFQSMENYLNHFGHPSKENCNEAANVPFFIISHAPIRIRERYLSFFKAAADLNYISKTSVAFYIDKVKVTKGEKQVYGTQYYWSKDNKTIYYPSIEPERLNERRREMGLENN